MKARGIMSRLNKQQIHMTLSQRRKLPVTVMAINPSTPRGGGISASIWSIWRDCTKSQEEEDQFFMSHLH